MTAYEVLTKYVADDLEAQLDALVRFLGAEDTIGNLCDRIEESSQLEHFKEFLADNHGG